MTKDTLFKAYDVRGRYPEELDEKLAKRIGQAFVQQIKAKKVIVGHDIRLSSPDLAAAVAQGLTEAGAEVLDIGQCGTEEVYFSVFHSGADGGIMVTASHNPKNWNGMKFVREEARPIGSDTGLFDIRDLVYSGEELLSADTKGSVQSVSFRDAYIDHLLAQIDVDTLKPLKILANPGNGCAGPVMEQLEERLPFTIVKQYFDPDGTFPNGVPNPLLPENRDMTAQALKESGCDLGVAWDGDFDRCFFFDENGRFIEGYYMVGLIAASILQNEPGGKIVHDPRLVWNTVQIAEECGGSTVQSRTGHSFIKKVMRDNDAVYGGEMSAHHYFRNFSYCDSGMIPWLLVAQLLCQKDASLSSLIDDSIARYPVSGEINRKVSSTETAIAAVVDQYEPNALAVERVDGVSFDYGDWRFNLRSSNTEPLLRLNVESKGDADLVAKHTADLLAIIENA